jgi:pimaricinolide synthase PimS2
VKSNLGHTAAAAGAAGVMKMVLALQHGVLPRTLHAGVPSRQVDWSAGDVRLLTEPVAWPAGGRPRRAGISAFGISGTNAHLIVEEAPAAAAGAEDIGVPVPVPVPVLAGGPVAWLVSGRSEAGLRGQAGRLRSWAAGAGAGAAPGDVAWSLATTRSVFEHRAVVSGGGRDELLAGLASVAAGQPGAGAVSGRVRPGGAVRAGFLFSGQGSQWAGMAAGLHAASAVFAAVFGQACGLLEAELGVPVAEVALGTGPDGPGDARADQTLYAQPGLFAVQAGLVAVLAAAGVRPDAVAGHSVGEVGAAYAAGVLSLQDACALVAARARGMQKLPGGGDGAPAGGDPALAELDRVAAVLAHAAPRVPWAGALDGELVTAPQPGYWAAAARRPVRFADAVATLAARGVEVFLEIGPDGTLSALGPAIAEAAEDRPGGTFVPVLRKDTSAAAAVTAALAEVHVRGVAVDWARVLPGGQRVDLPTYAFQHQRYWPITATATAMAVNGAVAGGDGAGSASEAQFWAAVDGGHLRELAAALEIDEARPFSQVVPVLAEWRRRERGERAPSWRYAVSWSALADPGLGALSGNWLLVTPERAGDLAGEVSAWCRGTLTGRGATVVTVRAGGETGREELAALIRAAMEDDAAGTFTGAVSLLALEEAPLPRAPGVAAGLAGTVGLVQALSDIGLAASLWVLTQGGVAAVPGDTIVSAVQGQVWGFGRVAALELPELWGGLVDVPPVLDERAGSLLCGVLAGCGEDQAAVRPAGVFVRRMVRASAVPATERWVPSGAVLVTGGTGAIGGHVARWLASRGARKVVLTSRSGPAAAGAAALAAELAGAGTAVEVTACDSGNGGDIASLVARLAAETPPLTAVFHAAGIEFVGSVLQTSPADLAIALAAKAGGAAALDAATMGLDLEAFVLFSSGSAIWGSGQQAGYATANAYLNALADSRHARGLPATSISWGLWGGGGMGSGPGGAYLTRMGLREMDSGAAIQSLAQALDSGEQMLTVADIDWDRFAPVFTLRRPSPLISALPEATRALTQDIDTSSQIRALRERLARADEAEQDRIVTDLVRGAAATVLGYPSADAVERNRSFAEQGLDSLTAVELRNRLNAATGLRLSGLVAFDFPTPAALSRQVRAQLAPAATPAGAGGAQPDDGKSSGLRYAAIGGEPAKKSASHSLGGLYAEAVRTGRAAEIVPLLVGLAAFRPTFAGISDVASMPVPAPLSRGPQTPVMMFFSSFFGRSGIGEYARLAPGFRGVREVSAIPEPGFLAGEPLPATIDALVSVQAELIRRSADDRPLVLAGHSSGGMVAHAVAARLAATGAGPAAVVLLDRFSLRSDSLSGDQWSALVTGMLANSRVDDGGDEAWVTAMLHYCSFDWTDMDEIDIPTLLVRAADPVGEPTAGSADSKLSWELSSNLATVDVPGDHFSMLTDHAGTTTQAINEWLSAL